MTGDTDFVALYRELGLRADCTMEQLKQAYRRRVGELHPDRNGSDASTLRLQQLNRLYAAATEFQRSHDRLPGAQRTSARRSSDSAAAAPGVEAELAIPPTPAQSRHVWRYALPLAALAALVFLYPTQPHPTTAASEATRPVPLVGVGVFAPAPDTATITIGMPVARARAIQGEPLNADKTRWDYGPSWIDVRCGRVSGWYSSPLRPLRVEPSTPGESLDAVTSTVKESLGC